MTGRQLAIQLLCRVEEEKSYSTLLLDAAFQRVNLDSAEKRLCARLYYGVIERQITLDAVIAKYSHTPLHRLDVVVRNILRLGVYQLCYCDRIPYAAAVNESVKLTRQLKKQSTAGMVNAILRAFLRDNCIIPMPSDSLEAMSIEYAIPLWLLKRLFDAYEEAQVRLFLQDALETSPRYIRRNSLRCTREQFETQLGDMIIPIPMLPDAYQINATDLREIPAFTEGCFFVQDISSQMCVQALGAQAGETIVDCCAAPGGKTCALALEMNDSGKIYAFDVAENRVSLMRENINRLGITCVTAQTADARALPLPDGCADRVLCDVPCSGIGVLRRKPEIKTKSPEEIDVLPLLQQEILKAAARLVKKGGTLVYSTCTILPAENEDVVSAFLSEDKSYQLMESKTLLPQMYGGDGFYYARLEKV